ncbi:YfiR family protein [Marivirga sp. S37H4]|uniref:YfiR family protein n=1 Tax=Marivirga aurantiaca TaxID=2802615 RepID=A0A934X198_9BACT|nr:YfiR family protein [Marivirga aurantiaca]MBK6267123.1 YfiR family protein [Marivirga aurantiaca]
MRNIKISAIFIFFFLCITYSGVSQGKDYRFHKVFFYSFTKYIQWPENYQGGDFIIAVLGDSEITPLLKEMAEIKKAGNNAIKIITINENGLNQKINMLFIPDSESGNFNNVKSKLVNKPTLLITESAGLASRGAMINFKDVEGKLKFEVNTTNLERSGLKVAQELIRFGEEVK